MGIDPERSLVTLGPDDVDIGPAAALRVRRHLPGEPGESESDRILVESVRQHGILRPPLLARVTDSRRKSPSPARTNGSSGKSLLLVQGFRRCAAAKHARIDAIEAFLLEVDERRLDAIGLRWLEDIHSGEPLSEYERILLTKKIRDLDAGAPLGGISKAYGKKLSEEHLSRLWRILGLDDLVLEALHRGDVSTGDLLLIMEHPFVDTGGAVGILASERLTRSEQKKAVHLMLRIGDGGADAWKRFAGSYEPGSGSLIDTLNKTAHPTLTGDLARIERIIRDMRLPPGVTITPPENMEGGHYRLQMPIRDERALEQALEKLKDAIDTKAVAELLRILRGEA